MLMKPLSVAHVGHVDAADDHARWRVVRDWLRDNAPTFFELLRRQEETGELEQHFLDLNRDPPRDFLAEEGAHDVVITHHLWGEMIPGYPTRTGGVAQSPHHGVDNWRRRLLQSGARYVFLAGGGFNLATLGGEVPGYERVAFLSRGYVNVLRCLFVRD
jgi:hypothetical protein